MLVFIDEKGNHHSALAEVKETKGVNGEKSISGVIYTNDDILEGIGRGWKVRFNSENYYLTYVTPIDDGRRIEVEFDAVHEFFFDMHKSVVHSQLDGSNTMRTYLNFIFDGSGYTYSLESEVAAFEKQSFGLKNRLTLFKDIISSTGLEFSVNGKIVRILPEVGTDLSTIVKKGFNMNELKIEKDVSSFITAQKGYGAFFDEEDHSKGRLVVEYVSPLAEIYGHLEGDPIIDERYTIKENLLKRVKQEVESSYGISATLDMEDLIQAGYEYERPHEGDYIMAINKDLKFAQKIRIISYTTEYDTAGTLLNHEVSCGSDSLVTKLSSAESSYRKNTQDAIDNVLNRAEEALTSANGKNTIYWGSSEPVGDFRKGDTWYQVIGEETVMKFWNGYEWELFFDPAANKKEVEEAQASAEEAKAAAEQAYIDSTQKAQELVDSASSAWDEKLSDTKIEFNSGLEDANSKISTAQAAAELAHETALDAANKSENNANDIVTISTNLGKLQTTVSGENGLTSQISQMSNQITSIVKDVQGNSASIVQLNNQISSVVEDVEGNKSSITQLATDISLKVGKDEVVSSINLSPELIRISGKKIQLDGDVLMNAAWIENLYADSAFITNLSTKTIDAISANITSIITNHLESNTISSSMIKADTALIDKLFATTALIEQLTSKTAFIQSIQAIDISADRIESGTIDANDVNIINLNVDKLVGNITSFVQSSWNGINNRINITSDGLESSRSDGSISAKYLSDGIQIWGGGKWAGSLSWASGPAVVLWAKKGHLLRLGYQGTNTESNVYSTALEISGDTGIVKTYSDIQMNGKALIGVKYFDGITYFNGTGDITVLGTKRFGNNYFTRSGGSRVMELVDAAFSGSATGVGWQSSNGSAGIMFTSDGNVLIKKNWGTWTIL